MNLYDTIYVRRSIRNYRMEYIDASTLEKLQQFEKELLPLFSDIAIRIEIICNLDKKNEIAGVFKAKAPYYLAFYSEKKEKYLLNAGYILEQISLFMVMQGIGSCFLGSAHKKKEPKEDSNYEFVIMMAFGLPKEELVRSAKTAKRFPMKELCVYKEQPRSWVEEVLQAARLAPSSMNNQPWRFVVYENRIHVFKKKTRFKVTTRNKWTELDFGIMLSHVMIVVEEMWVDTEMIKLDNITHKLLQNHEYIISIILKP